MASGSSPARRRLLGRQPSLLVYVLVFVAQRTYGLGTDTSQAKNTAIADTGTTLCLVSDALVDAVYKAIPGAKYDDTQQGYLFPSTTTIDQFPKVGFELNGTTFYIQPEDLGFADAGNGMTYGGIQSRGNLPSVLTIARI